MLRKKIKKKNSLNINVTRLAVKNITNENVSYLMLNNLFEEKYVS